MYVCMCQKLSKYNRYHLFRKDMQWREEAGSSVSGGDRSLSIITRILKISSPVFSLYTNIKKATKIINLKLCALDV